MSNHCQVTGASPSFGNNVSHSHRRTRRRWDVNVQKKRYWVPSLGRTVTLTVSPRGIRTIDKHGIDAVIADMRARGERF
ncbi:MAG: 50S ribosomal protein L28 [Actinomyces sp.]|jgi:large subunit ribosomal protein L28|uniref:Large ribosomal subunit protein bL28 n=1 Tax=Schaalia naturae TaxID=635203 RepID=A0ABW2SN79_9ACTO|nr:50S ribosomal protein L28 [Actinomyces sp.]MCI1642836.1 50S ribosomal protein L28 [Actinomyces sp.]MCI1662457.1 50S ribosomal protein L28 [Actinomyces sp.]MCI1692112.1 50S ribosomal protein L28 [Actinomyces sp.]MCI1788932.1 50S ribosomal protein L28 [Actinomyces sp.]MCI1830034.1 50S ribosomal protein L28 [Actinomyces sp.]